MRSGAWLDGGRARRWLVRALPLVAIAMLLVVRAIVATPQRAALAPDGSGSLDIARGGPVIVGVQGAGTLEIAGRHIGRSDSVASRTGSVAASSAAAAVRTERIVLPRGPIAIRFTGGGRLVWSPVGRRGDPEYVPASSLSPDPPDRARFPAWAGAAPFDGVIASLILLVVVGSVLYLARHRLRAVPREHYLAMAAIFAAACVVRWIDLSGFGQTWDEDVNWAAGRNYVTNLLALDFHARSWIWNYEHPPVMKILEGIGAQFADGFGPARALSAVWTALGCALLVPIGAKLYRLRTGILAGAIAALLPPLVAHGQIVGHESPTVLWWTLAVLLALTAGRSRARLAWVGVVIGLAAASRFVNGLVAPLALIVVIVEEPAAWRDAVWILPATALATFWAVWPRLWLHPIGALRESLVKLAQSHAPEPFLGTVTAHPPLYYFVVYLLATLPIGVLAGVLAWPRRNRATLVTALWLVIPLGVAFSPVRQDGVRYVMPSVVALALASAAGWERLAGLARFRHAFVAIAGALVIYLAVTLVRIHPYYLDYFAEQVGGTHTVAAQRWFETAWWGEGVDRAVAYVNEHAAPGDRVYRDCILPAHLAWFREDLWTPMVHSPAQARWIVRYGDAPCAIPPDARRVFTVAADGATLAEVWQRPDSR